MQCQESDTRPAASAERTRKSWGNTTQLACAAFVVVGATALLIPLSARHGWEAKLLDLAHVPLFCVGAIIFTRVTGNLAWALLLVAAMAGAGELLQHLVGRSASFLDFVNGLIGGLLVAVWWHGAPMISRLRDAWRWLATIGLLVIPVSDAIPLLGHAAWAFLAFPTLCDFQQPWQTVNWEPRQATLRISADPEQSRRRAACLRLLPGPERIAGTSIRMPCHDWSGYRALYIELITTEAPLELHVALHGTEGSGGRIRNQWKFQPGTHEVRIDLTRAEVESDTPVGSLDIQRLVIWAATPQRPRTLYIRQMRLEPL